MSDTMRRVPEWGEMAHFVSVFSHQFFVAPADQNYYLARFARMSGLHEEFWWQALQSVEKYLKAGLLMNGRSVKKFGHNIEELYAAHCEVFAELALKSVEKTDDVAAELWHSATLSNFLRRVANQGNPDTRYGLVSYSNRPEDILVLDQVVFELRRRTIGLDWIVGEQWPEPDLQPYIGQSYREVLLAEPERQLRQIKVPNGNLSHVGGNFSDVFHSWNIAFRRTPEDVEKPLLQSLVPIVGGKNNHLFLFFNSLRPGKADAEISEKVQWLCDNIPLSGSVARELVDRLQAARRHSPSP